MDLELKGKVAWIVGGSAGIGRACAKSLLVEGAKVVISARKKQPLEQAVVSLENEVGEKASFIQVDAIDHEKMEKAFQCIISEFGKIDILIYAAGISHPGKLMDLSVQDWSRNWNLNVVSFFNTIQLVVPEFKKQGNGRIVVTGAASGKQPTPNQLISNTTKGSLMPMVKTLAEELAEDQILINNVCPGRFLTPRRLDLAKDKQEKLGVSQEEYLQEVANAVPLKRLGEPMEIADLVTFLVSSKGSYITGQSISVDGGLIRGVI
ncbi:SDR family NAD(P)-dependent oxidoreductase [Virgibacillus sp. DJP39]|uniref:SDR family NAD(P)-dependent oxidoreductase n=1 Tax=Virgibacillus sp. DJP39 TaxID=3409790 RepID=UPI003BB5C5CE